MEGYPSSGLSKKAYCESLGIKEHVFYYWQRRFSELEEELPVFSQLELESCYELELGLCGTGWIGLRSNSIKTLSSLIEQLLKQDA